MSCSIPGYEEFSVLIYPVLIFFVVVENSCPQIEFLLRLGQYNIFVNFISPLKSRLI